MRVKKRARRGGKTKMSEYGKNKSEEFSIVHFPISHLFRLHVDFSLVLSKCCYLLAVLFIAIIVCS